MQLVVCQNHKGEGEFPTFRKGTRVDNLSSCLNYPQWFSCDIEGWQTYVLIHFLDQQILNCDYNPTELEVKEGDVVELLSVHFQWAVVQHQEEVGCPLKFFAPFYRNCKLNIIVLEYET